MRISDYITRGMPEMASPYFENWKIVRDQAATHTIRGRQSRIQDVKRPNRPTALKEYVSENARNITMGEFRLILLKLSRIIRSTDLRINIDSDPVKTWNSQKPFKILGQNRDIYDYIYEAIIYKSLVDPNAVLIPWPTQSSGIRPAAPVNLGGLPETELPLVEPLLIGSKDIRFRDSSTIVWELEEIQVDKGREMMYGFLSQEDGFYRLIPYKEDGKIRYRGELWFFKAFRSSPISLLPGFRVEADGVEYQESFAQPFFEYGDEFISAFGDNQAVRDQHAFPKVVIDEIPCPEKGCKNGYIVSYENGEEKKKTECAVCHGHGVITNLDPYQILRRKRVVGKDSTPTPLMEYVTPPVEILKESFTVAFEMLKKGKQAIGLSLLGSEQESGIAKLYRLEDLEDLLQAYTGSMLIGIVSFLNSVDEILNPKYKEESISYVLPRSFALHNVADLSDILKGIPDSLRGRTYDNIVELLYEGDKAATIAHTTARIVEPLLMYSLEEVKNLFAIGLVTSESIYSRSHAEEFTKEYLHGKYPSGVDFEVASDPVNIAAIREQIKTAYVNSQTVEAQVGGDPTE